MSHFGRNRSTDSVRSKYYLHGKIQATPKQARDALLETGHLGQASHSTEIHRVGKKKSFWPSRKPTCGTFIPSFLLPAATPPCLSYPLMPVMARHACKPATPASLPRLQACHAGYGIGNFVYGHGADLVGFPSSLAPGPHRDFFSLLLGSPFLSPTPHALADRRPRELDQ